MTQRRRRAPGRALLRGLRRCWWAVIEFIANRYVFMEIAPWVFPVVGGLLVSTHIGQALDWFWLGVGALVILVGTVPLGIRAYYLAHVQKGRDEQDARERVCLRIVSSMVPRLPAEEQDTRGERIALRDRSVEDAVESLVSSAYPARRGYRVTFYALGENEHRQVQIKPVISRGRGDMPRTHTVGGERFEGMLELLQSPSESTSESGISKREYTSFASASVSRGEELYGILAIDTNGEVDLGAPDESNLVPIAHVLAAFFAAVDRGKRPPERHIWRRGLYYVGTLFTPNRKGTP